MLHCPNCGTKSVQGDKFCRECGNNLNVIRTENVCAGPDEQYRGPLMGNVFISEPPKPDSPMARAMMENFLSNKPDENSRGDM